METAGNDTKLSAEMDGIVLDYLKRRCGDGTSITDFVSSLVNELEEKINLVSLGNLL